MVQETPLRRILDAFTDEEDTVHLIRVLRSVADLPPDVAKRILAKATFLACGTEDTVTISMDPRLFPSELSRVTPDKSPPPEGRQTNPSRSSAVARGGNKTRQSLPSVNRARSSKRTSSVSKRATKREPLTQKEAILKVVTPKKIVQRETLLNQVAGSNAKKRATVSTTIWKLIQEGVLTKDGTGDEIKYRRLTKAA